MKNLLLLALLANFGVYAAAGSSAPSRPALYAYEYGDITTLSRSAADLTDKLTAARADFDRALEKIRAEGKTPQIGDSSYLIADKIQQLEEQYDMIQSKIAELLLRRPNRK